MKRIELLLVLYCLTATLFGGQIIHKDLREMTLEELMDVKVSSASRYMQKISEAPASIMIITHKQILERGYFDLSDLLKDIPGIDIVDNARGFGEFYTIRGIEGNDRFLVLVDGQRLNPVSGTFLSVGNSISIRFAERVEILFGPGSVVYGADAFAGVISIFNRKDSDTNTIQAYADFGSQSANDAGVQFRKSISDDFKVNMMARVFKSDGPDFFSADSIYTSISHYKAPLVARFEQPLNDYNVLLNARYRGLNLSWYRQRFDEGNALTQHPKSNIYNRENRWKLTSDIIWADYQHQFSKKRDLSISLAWVRHIQDPETQFLKTRQAYDYSDVFSQYLTGEDRTWRSAVNFHHVITDNLQFLAGMELENTQSIPPYANDQVLGTSAKFEGENARLIADELTVHELREANYLEFTYKPKQIFAINGGIRYDYSSRYEATVNPRVSLRFKPFKMTSIKAIYGTAFQAPSLFYQYEQWGGATAVMLSAEELQELNPDWKLKNQRIRTTDIVLDHHFSRRTHFSVSAYNHQLRDLIERVIYTDTAYNKYFSTADSAVYSLGFRNENKGVQDVYGLVVSLKACLTSQASMYAQYAYTLTQDDDTEIPRVAVHKVWLGATYISPRGYLTVSPRLKWVGEVNNQNTDIFPGGKQPGYTSLDLSASLENIWEYTRIFFRGENILNTRIEHAGLYDQRIYLPVAHQPGFVGRIGIEFSIQ